MFEDSLIESGGRLKTKRGVTTFLSFGLQIALVGVWYWSRCCLPKLCPKPS